MHDGPIIHPGVDTSGKPPPRRRRARSEPPASSWWANRFLQSVEATAGPGRLSRGLEYARRGRVDELAVEPGHASALVQGSRPTPYRVALRLAAFDDALWARALAHLGAEAAPAAALAAGTFPEGAEDAFARAGVALFPGSDERVAAACTCPDATRPCKHAAALVYTLASRFDKDPFVLFALRGRSREQLLAELRIARKRAAGRHLPAAPAEAVPCPGGPYQRPGRPPDASGSSLGLTTDPARFWASPAIQQDGAALPADDTLKRLGLPPRALGGVELKMELALAYRLLAERAGKARRGD